VSGATPRRAAGGSGAAGPPPGRGGTTQQCYCTRIATLRFLEIGCACGVTLAPKVSLLTRNRVNSRRWAVGETAKDIFKAAGLRQTTPLFRESQELLINCKTAVRWQSDLTF